MIQDRDIAVYLDLDDVEADYVSGIRRLGFNPDPAQKDNFKRQRTGNPFKRQMFEAIKGTDFYRTLPFMPGAIELYMFVERYEPLILTAAPTFGEPEEDHLLNPYWQGAAYHKRAWVEEELLAEVKVRRLSVGIHGFPKRRVPIPDLRFICTTSERKHLFIGRKDAEHQILIDDRRDNCVRWARAGGVAILHVNEDRTLRTLIGFIHESPYPDYPFTPVAGGGRIAGLEDVRTWVEIEAAHA